MKRIQLIILYSAVSFLAAAQDFTPLRIDSSYSFFRSLDFDGNPIEVVSFAGYTYNEEGQVLQIRRKNERSNFTYIGGQEVELLEVFVNGFWENSKRITTTLADGQPAQILTEIYPDGFWENSRRVTINYAENDELLSQLTQIWENNEWKNQELIENTYNAADNRIRQSYSNTDQDGNFIFTFGDRISFNDFNQPTEILALTGNGAGGIFFSDKFTITYSGDQLQETIIYCLYNFPDTVSCQNLSRSVFTYDQVENRTIRDIDSWNGDEWVSSGRIEEYAGRNIYSGLPDSILTYDYSLTTTDQLITKQYFAYEDLNEEEVCYREFLFLYDVNLGQFVLENYREKYYQKEEIVANHNLTESKELIISPNPVSAGKVLTISGLSAEFRETKIRIYGALGQLVRREILGANDQFNGPTTPGIYFIEIKKENGTTILQKLIVH